MYESLSSKREMYLFSVTIVDWLNFCLCTCHSQEATELCRDEKLGKLSGMQFLCLLCVFLLPLCVFHKHANFFMPTQVDDNRDTE